jgi:hypothetical protein
MDEQRQHPLLMLSSIKPKPPEYNYLNPSPEELEQHTRDMEAKRRLIMSQKPEEALVRIKSGRANLETIGSCFCLTAYLYEEVKKLKEASIQADVSNPKTQPENTDGTIRSFTFSLLRSLFINKISIAIISLCVGGGICYSMVIATPILLKKYLP